MIAWQVVGLLATGGILGWVAHAFEVGAERERQIERRYTPPRSHVRPVAVPYDQTKDDHAC